MKRRITLSLFAIFIFFTIGAVIAVNYIRDTSTELNRIIELHQVEQLRRSLVIDIQTVQSNLYSINTPFANEIDSIIESALNLERTAQKCTSCHHPPQLLDRIREVQFLIKDYEANLSLYITSSANSERLKKLKKNAVSTGNQLRSITEQMSHSASSNLNEETSEAMTEINHVKVILFVTLIVTLLLSIMVAVGLTKSVTRPINALVNATRMISSGKFGSVISYKDKTEFGELAEHFNTMSTAIKSGYEKIREEIRERWQAEEALINSEKFLNTIFDSFRDPFCIFDKEYNIVRANKAYADLKNKGIESLIGKRCYEILHGKDSVCKDCIVEKSFKSADPCAKDKLLVSDDGSRVWFEIYTYPIYDVNGRVSHIIEYTRDITDRKLAEEAMRESEERYVLASRGANDGLWDWDIKSNVIYYSPRWKSMLGYEENKITNSPDEWLNRIHPDDRVQVETAITANINGHTPNFKSEHRILHKDGSYLWVLSRGLAVHNGSPKAYRMAGSMTDITERKEAEEQLIFDALHDSLTGLPNRTLFMDRLEHAVNRERRLNEYMFAVLFLDMDRFKVLNDSLGHTLGDRLLIAVSQRLGESLRPGDTVARLGGDEFAVLLEDLTDREEAIQIAERIQGKLSRSFNLNGQEVFTSASIGIAFSTTGYDQPDHLLRNADIAMYYSKSNGGAHCEIFDTGMYAHAVARLRLETDLRQALKQNEFVLHYQPIVSMETGRITGLEALVRWRHPDRDLIYPDEFIPTAEETGLIVNLGDWVLQEACRQLQIWDKKFPAKLPLTVSVNISSKQLLPNLLEHIKRVLQETELEPNRLVLEITESMIMENAELATPLLLLLKNMDVKLHIDDFGTGYSSLSYLHDFPVDVLKIDRSFVTRLGFNGENMEIVRTITTLAHSLNMDVIAEGVETESQLAQLKALNCEYVQGYLFSKPLNSEGVEDLLRKGKFDLKNILTHSANR
jgi:diguanylate cyclase (GGDEF)-like protein/PAS domain S-box-containing protein